ncbi:DNA polymerase III subunit epsilon [Paremcibacter congregatus]|uniref:DNA polymerase III subunit epsilon n=1 Tax=Paremcibacter congregatus TaxID=2043170 RepID=UPI0030EE0C14|tara:strand:- start:121 stop:813 length:693 start_codon:yes stop_codon:yes gene_type:complete
MREIVFDTETTGFDPFNGDRLVEIGCVEVENFLPTGNVYHQYVNPERDMPEGAFKIHGLSEEFLKGYPTFAEIYAEFVDFVGDANLVAHNADFDMKFINYELSQVGHREYPKTRAIDTLNMARRKFPGSPNTLDALCKRFSVDNSNRIKHGALLDAELLAEVYLELRGGRQRGLELDTAKKSAADTETVATKPRILREARPHAPSAEELLRHAEFVAKIGQEALWHKVKA